MAQEKALVSMAQQFTGLPMDSLIGAPLNAATKANAGMAIVQTQFLLDTCFSKGEGDSYTPIMINMSIERGVLVPVSPGEAPTIESVTTTFNLPLLTIIPLNSLAVDSVQVDFDMEVQSSYGEEESSESSTEKAGEASFEAKIGYGGCFQATVQGSASYKKTKTDSSSSHYDKSNSAKYSVAVHAGQLPLPEGVTTIIQAFTAAIDPVEMPTTSAA